jgi:hypothetical protein
VCVCVRVAVELWILGSLLHRLAAAVHVPMCHMCHICAALSWGSYGGRPFCRIRDIYWTCSLDRPPRQRIRTRKE